MKLKILFIALIIALVLAPMQSASAQGANPPTPASYQDIIKLYGLKVADTIPAGVTPLRFNSPKELESFLSTISLQAKTPTNVTYIEKAPLGYSTLATTYAVVTRSCSKTLSFAKFNTWADIRVGVNGSFRWIDSVLNTRTGLTGVTVALTLDNAYSYAYNQTSSSVSVQGGGIVNAWLLVGGVIRLYSTPVSCSFTYRLY